MKDKILKLRNEGKTYNEIVKIIGCSKSTVSYYCGDNQKEKSKNRIKKRRENILIRKSEVFNYRKKERYKKESLRKFQKRDNDFKNKIDIDIKQTFKWTDIIEKFGENTYCYLSGEKLNLYENEYNLDHIIPTSKNGDNSINNLGITHKYVNKMKSDLSVEELIIWCEKILKFNGYTVYKR